MSLYEKLHDKLGGRQYNGYFSCCCPFHNDTHPSFFVWEDGGWYCKSNSCHSRGKSLEELDRRLGGREIKARKVIPQVLPKWREWEQKWGDLEGIACHAHETCINRPNEMWYFRDRQIDQFFKVGMFGRIDNWCLFPVFNEHKKIVSIVLRYTGKNRDTRYITHQTVDGKQYLYIPNHDRVNNSEYVILCYGIIDAWSFEDIGLPVITGCTGKFSSPELILPLHKKVYIVPDLGEESDAHKLANSLGWRGKVINLLYPNDCKDGDEIRIKHGKDVLLNMIKGKINETN